MKSILYLSFYDVITTKEKRKYAISAKNKSDYLIASMEKNGIEVDFISASGVSGNHFVKGRTETIGKSSKLTLFPSIGDGNIVFRIIDRNLIKLRILFRLLKTNKNEPIIVYHSLSYMNVVRLAHKIRKFRLILEVEEIYSDVIGKKSKRNREINFLEEGDSYIFPTSLLNNLVNIYHKPYVIVHGSYRVENIRDSIFKEKSNDKSNIIHCVYSGTFDPRKGCLEAVKSAVFLPSNYHIHIIGFGNQRDIEVLQKTISSVNNKCDAVVTYDGLKSGEEYIRFIQSCEIGLCTQDPNADYNQSSFPSKILSYLSNGLRVVSIRIPAIVNSKIGNLIFFYNTQSPETIANTITSIDLKKYYDSRSYIEKLNAEFIDDICQLINQRNEV